jgi:hypothetical protein
VRTYSAELEKEDDVQTVVILNGSNIKESRQLLESEAHVAQEGSEKVLVVDGSPAQIAHATSKAGATPIGDLPAEQKEQLSPAEKLFIDAWSAREGFEQSKTRFGDGLSWGAKGFLPI